MEAKLHPSISLLNRTEERHNDVISVNGDLGRTYLLVASLWKTTKCKKAEDCQVSFKNDMIKFFISDLEFVFR